MKPMLDDSGLPLLSGFMVLSERKMEDTYHSVIECSWSIELSTDRAQFYWSSQKATSNFGGSFAVDGRKHADEMKAWAEKQLPDFPFKVWDVRDPALPIELNWKAWERAHEPSDRNISGVVDKFTARNVPFKCKPEIIA